MPKRRNMCPSESCERYGVETGLMGGCECGTALVAFKSREQQIDDAMWEALSPTLKRLVGYGLTAEIDRQRRQQRG